MSKKSRDFYCIQRRDLKSWLVALCFFVFACGIMAPFPAHAQVPGELVPGRQYQEVFPQVPPPPQVPPTEFMKPPSALDAPEGSEMIRFKLSEVIFEGATVFDQAYLKAKTAAPFMGAETSIADLYKVANAVTSIYAEKGYVLSFAFVPEQSIKDGVVRIHVVEGFVDKVLFRDMEGGEGLEKMNRLLRKKLPDLTRRLKASKPLKSDVLHRAILLINDIPGMTAKAVFNASEDVQNASTLTLNISYERLEASVSADNHLSANFDYYSFGGMAILNGAFTGKDALQVSARCGLSCETYNQQSVAWSTYIGSDGLKLELTTQRSGTAPSNGILSNLDFSGTEEGLGANLSYPVLRSLDKNLRLGMSLDWTHSKTETFAGTLTEDRLTTANVYASYDFTDRTGASTLINLGTAEGLPYFNATKDGDALKSRANGSSTFTNFTAAVSRMQPLGFMFPELQRFSIYASGNAQYAGDDPLLSSSQCYYGSVGTGRGYNSGALGGDHCVMGIVELRYDSMVAGQFVQLYSFGDAGTVWRKGPLLAGEEREDTAKSIGGGVRVMSNKNLEGDLEVALPLDKAYAPNGKGTPRVHFSVTWRY
jgi:hemolysin activation/secretion protein